MSIGLKRASRMVTLIPQYSSLHDIIFNSFRLVFVLWRLLTTLRLSICDVIVVQKKVPLETESSNSMGGANTLMQLPNHL